MFTKCDFRFLISLMVITILVNDCIAAGTGSDHNNAKGSRRHLKSKLKSKREGDVVSTAPEPVVAEKAAVVAPETSSVSAPATDVSVSSSGATAAAAPTVTEKSINDNNKVSNELSSNSVASDPTFEDFDLNEIEIALAKTLYLLVKPQLRRAVDQTMQNAVQNFKMKYQRGHAQGQGQGHGQSQGQGPLGTRPMPMNGNFNEGRPNPNQMQMQRPQPIFNSPVQQSQIQFHQVNPGLKMKPRLPIRPINNNGIGPGPGNNGNGNQMNGNHRFGNGNMNMMNGNGGNGQGFPPPQYLNQYNRGPPGPMNDANGGFRRRRPINIKYKK